MNDTDNYIKLNEEDLKRLEAEMDKYEGYVEVYGYEDNRFYITPKNASRRTLIYATINFSDDVKVNIQITESPAFYPDITAVLKTKHFDDSIIISDDPDDDTNSTIFKVLELLKSNYDCYIEGDVYSETQKDIHYFVDMYRNSTDDSFITYRLPLYGLRVFSLEKDVYGFLIEHPTIVEPFIYLRNEKFKNLRNLNEFIWHRMEMSKIEHYYKQKFRSCCNEVLRKYGDLEYSAYPEKLVRTLNDSESWTFMFIPHDYEDFLFDFSYRDNKRNFEFNAQRYASDINDNVGSFLKECLETFRFKDKSWTEFRKIKIQMQSVSKQTIDSINEVIRMKLESNKQDTVQNTL